MFFVDSSSKEAIYQQLKKQIVEMIAIQVLQEGDKLPSVRALAIQLGVNPNTVSKAYSQLEEEKMIYSVNGVGCFVAKMNDQIHKYKINSFYDSVKDMKKHGISENVLYHVIKEVYTKKED